MVALSKETPQQLVGAVFPEGLGRKCGWKIGGWPKKGVLGPLFSNVVQTSAPFTLSLAQHNLGTLEAELGFVLGKDLEMHSDGTVPSHAEIWDATDQLHLVIEACGLRCGVPHTWLSADEGADASYKLADACVNAAVLVGPPLLKKLKLDTTGAHLCVNGEVKSSGTGSEVNGNPLNSVQWLIVQGVPGGLKKGDLIISGALCKLAAYQAGDVITAKFADAAELVGGTGALELRIE
jgi:2-keto-4-pentenoate hydratase